jgi:Activator of Hsp90 ATPase homolog 1-like protein
MKKTLHFPIRIDAPRERVWSVMLEPDTFNQWTAPFCEGSYYEGGWNKGDRIRFLTPTGEGMVSEIVESRPHEFVSIRHLGEIKDGVEDTTSEKVRAWAPAYENYTYEAAPGGGTQLRVDVDVLPDYEQFMQDTFPKALARLKELCERVNA